MLQEEVDLQEKKIPIVPILLIGTFLLLIAGVAAFFVFQSRSSVSSASPAVEKARAAKGPLETYDHPLFTEQQQNLLKSIGVDVRDIPEELSPKQEACLIEAVGEERYREVLAGGALTTGDFLKGKGCFGASSQ